MAQATLCYMGTQLSLPKRGTVHQFSAHVCCGQRTGWIKMQLPLGMEVGIGPGHIVLDGDPTPPPLKGHSPPHCQPVSVVAKLLEGSGCQLVGGRPRPKRHCVRWGPSSPPQKGGTSIQFSAHVCCCQTAGWIKMPLGAKVGLGPGHIVLHGDPTPPPNKGHSPPTFWPMFIVAKWLDGSRCHLVRR